MGAASEQLCSASFAYWRGVALFPDDLYTNQIIILKYETFINIYIRKN